MKMVNEKVLAQLVLNFRTENSLSQRAFAKKVGVSYTTIQNVESEKDIMLGVALKIADAINCNLFISPKFK